MITALLICFVVYAAAGVLGYNMPALLAGLQARSRARRCAHCCLRYYSVPDTCKHGQDKGRMQRVVCDDCGYDAALYEHSCGRG